MGRDSSDIDMITNDFHILTFSPEGVDNESQTRKFQLSFFTFLSHDI